GNHSGSGHRRPSGLKGDTTLALANPRQGRHAEALAQWRLVVRERPDFLPAWLGLGENALARGDHAALEEVAGRLEGLPGGGPEGDLLRAAGLLARKDFAAARALAERVAAAHPQAVQPRLVLRPLPFP